MSVETPSSIAPSGSATAIADVERPAGTGNREIGWISDVAAEMLQRLGVRYVSLNPGASYRGLHDSLVNYLGNRDPQMLICLHEDHAVSVAHGYARASGEPMGCILHSNVGLMHGLMGLYNAWCNRVPMLVLGATGPVDATQRRPWIDWIHTAKDQGALLRNFIKWDDEPRSAGAMVESLCRAMTLTRSAPRAPVYVCLDVGMQEQATGVPVELPDLSRYPVPAPPAAPSAVVKQAAEALAAAGHPLIMVGRTTRGLEAWNNRVRLAERLGARVMTDLRTGASFPTEHPAHCVPTGVDLLAAENAVLAVD